MPRRQPSPPRTTAAGAYDASIDWLEAPYAEFSICYTAAYADDVPWVASWLTYIDRHLSWKYGTEELRTVREQVPGLAYFGGANGAKMHVNVMLLPAPDANANYGLTRFMIGWGTPAAHAMYGPISGATRYAFIPYVTPGAPGWANSSRWGVLQVPPGDFHAKNLMHEYTHAVQHTILHGEPAWYVSTWPPPVPQWMSEGLAEYEGQAHTTPHQQTAAYQNLIRYVVEQIPNQILLRSSQDLTGNTHAAHPHDHGRLLRRDAAGLLPGGGAGGGRARASHAASSGDVRGGAGRRVHSGGDDDGGGVGGSESLGRGRVCSDSGRRGSTARCRLKRQYQRTGLV